MRARLKAIMATTLIAVSIAPAAHAGWRDHHDYGYGYGHGYDRHHGRHSRGHFSFNFYSPPEPIFIEPSPIYYEPPQAYIPAPTPYPANYNNTGEDRYCREYTRPAQVGGRMQQTYGTACMQPDGDWQIID